MKNQASLKLENQTVVYRFRWDYWAAATFDQPTRTSTTTRTATNLQFNLEDRNEIFTMAGRGPDRHWKTADYKMSGQLKRLEIEHAELLKTLGTPCWCEKSIGSEENNLCRKNISMFLRNLRWTRRKRKTAEVTTKTNVFRNFRQWHQAYLRRK